MLLILIVLAIAFLVIREIAVRAGITALSASLISCAVCLAFVGGSVARPISLPGSTVAGPDPVLAPAIGSGAQPEPAVEAASPGPLHLTAQQVSALIAEPGATAGAVDVVDVSADRSTALVAGWVVDPATKGPAHAIILIVDGRYRFDATPFYGQDRPDVARALSVPAAEHSGFAGAVVPLRGIAGGKHTIACAAVANGRYRIASATRSFTL